MAFSSYACMRRQDWLAKSIGGFYTPQGPLWNSFVEKNPALQDWPKILSTVNWRRCGVCDTDPLDVWLSSGDWKLFQKARTLMMVEESARMSEVILDVVTELFFY